MDRTNRPFGKIYAGQAHLTLHFLPPYSPEHNPIERIWGELHTHVTRNHQCCDIDDLMNLVGEFLERAAPYPGNKLAMAV